MRKLPTIKEIQESESPANLIGLMLRYRLAYARHFRNAVILGIADEMLGTGTYQDVAAECSRRLGVEISVEICKKVCN